MKKLSLEARLIAAKPNEVVVDRNFTDRVMNKINVVNIATSQTRSRNLFSRLRQLPKVAIIAIAIAALMLIGGTTYAIYKTLWEQPSVTTKSPTTNQFGRTQVVASFENCSDQSAQATFEIKSGSTLDPSEIGKILQARCELDAIRNWSGESSLQNMPHNLTEGTAEASTIMVSPVASKVVSISDTSLSLTGDQYNTPTSPLVLTKQTQYIVNNIMATRDQIHPGDTVVYIEKITVKYVTTKTPTGTSSSGTPIARATTYVIKVDLPYEYYGPVKQNQIAERQACIGNPQDSCVQTALVDLYGPGGTATLKSDGNGGYTNEMRQIQGIITEHDGQTIKLKSSSGRIFTITTPSDIINDFNQNRSANYNNTKVAVGDMLQVSYIVDKNDTGLTLDKSQITSIQLALNIIQKGDSIKKY